MKPLLKYLFLLFYYILKQFWLLLPIEVLAPKRIKKGEQKRSLLSP